MRRPSRSIATAVWPGLDSRSRQGREGLDHGYCTAAMASSNPGWNISFSSGRVKNDLLRLHSKDANNARPVGERHSHLSKLCKHNTLAEVVKLGLVLITRVLLIC